MSKQAQSRQPSEFRNFKELTERLIAVPKKEVDEKKAEYEGKKQKKEKPAK